MYTLRVEAEFSAAHYLNHYQGKCERLHGHNYRVRAYTRGASLDEGGMILDFSQFKTLLREVCGKIDHQNLNDFQEFSGDPSAERIAHYIFTNLENLFEVHGLDSGLLVAIEVFETPTNMARYEREQNE
jgi:6-pyruvoyltetrahydropterin/6-carboxytetrahydropterin synthase